MDAEEWKEVIDRAAASQNDAIEELYLIFRPFFFRGLSWIRICNNSLGTQRGLSKEEKTDIYHSWWVRLLENSFAQIVEKLEKAYKPVEKVIENIAQGYGRNWLRKQEKDRSLHLRHGYCLAEKSRRKRRDAAKKEKPLPRVEDLVHPVFMISTRNEDLANPWIFKYVFKCDNDTIAEKLGISKTTVWRRIRKVWEQVLKEWH